MTRRNHHPVWQILWLAISLSTLFVACASSHTMTVAANPTPTGTANPTATATMTPVPTVTPISSLDSKYAYASFSTNFSSNELVDVSDVSTDGKRVYGALLNPADCQGPQSSEQVGVGWMDVQTRHVTQISLPGASFTGGSFVTMVNAGQLIAAFETVFQQSKNSVTKFWIFNPVTNSVAQSFAGKALTMLVSDNQVIVNDPVTGLAVANMQTQSIASLVGTQPPSAGTLTPVAFASPYLLYTVQQGQATPVAHVYDLSTSQDAALPQLSQAIADDINPGQNLKFTAAIANNTIYFTDLNTQSNGGPLEALTPIMTPPTQATSPANFGSGVSAANARVVLSDGGFEVFLWDLVTKKLFLVANSNAPDFGSALLSGKYLAVRSYFRPADCTQSENVTLFDTTTLPTS